jgi:hypothetical protein
MDCVSALLMIVHKKGKSYYFVSDWKAVSKLQFSFRVQEKQKFAILH